MACKDIQENMNGFQIFHNFFVVLKWINYFVSIIFDLGMILYYDKVLYNIKNHDIEGFMFNIKKWWNWMFALTYFIINRKNLLLSRNMILVHLITIEKSWIIPITFVSIQNTSWLVTIYIWRFEKTSKKKYTHFL